jgi:hypothetical protein
MPLFAEDGCIQPNLRTWNWRFTLKPDCEHAHVQGAQFTVKGQTMEDAARFVNEYILPNFTRNHIDEIALMDDRAADHEKSADLARAQRAGYDTSGWDQEDAR